MLYVAVKQSIPKYAFLHGNEWILWYYHCPKHTFLCYYQMWQLSNQKHGELRSFPDICNPLKEQWCLKTHFTLDFLITEVKARRVRAAKLLKLIRASWLHIGNVNLNVFEFNKQPGSSINMFTNTLVLHWSTDSTIRTSYTYKLLLSVSFFIVLLAFLLLVFLTLRSTSRCWVWIHFCAVKSLIFLRCGSSHARSGRLYARPGAAARRRPVLVLWHKGKGGKFEPWGPVSRTCAAFGPFATRYAPALISAHKFPCFRARLSQWRINKLRVKSLNLSIYAVSL